jgi:tetratricopeptide repeat protein
MGILSAFIVRPFGEKKGVNFDKVESDLIGPALDRLGIPGRTTAEITEQGNIRLDMFQLLLTSDLVIADISIHNANVFYELGIRHALRDQHTFLIRYTDKDLPADEVPFDLKTDRYLTYPRSDPKSKLEDLVQALEATKLSEKPDSPVFLLLPGLEAQDPARFLPVPRGFQEEVELAAERKQPGDLGLLAAEARYFPWVLEGLRVVGRQQLRLKGYKAAKETWEYIRRYDPDDIEANTWLGTIYERLKELTLSDQAVERVLAQNVTGPKRAEALALAARNAKTRWKNGWQVAPAEKQPEEALRSGLLEESYKAYRMAFEVDLNHYYPGLNALAMLKVRLALAETLPDVWADAFDRPRDAENELAELLEQAQKLATAVEVCLDATRDRLEREGKEDIWLDISAADLCCLTSDRPRRVVDAYKKAREKASAFDLHATRQQLEMYQELGILKDNVVAALEAIPVAAENGGPEKVLLFTGHRIDAAGREKPRFPRTEKAEEEARLAIREKIVEEQQRSPIAYGIAGGASGGDILFLEVCAELGIKTWLYLALPKDQYIVKSVQDAGPEWVDRFNELHKRHLAEKRLRELADTEELPQWLATKKSKDYLWQRNNLWMLNNALADEKRDLTLIALWDGKDQGDGPGGTVDLVRRAQERGAKFVHIPTNELFGIGA